MTVFPFLRLAALLFLSAALLACAANPALEESRQAFATRSPELALRELRDKLDAPHYIPIRKTHAELVALREENP